MGQGRSRGQHGGWEGNGGTSKGSTLHTAFATGLSWQIYSYLLLPTLYTYKTPIYYRTCARGVNGTHWLLNISHSALKNPTVFGRRARSRMG